MEAIERGDVAAALLSGIWREEVSPSDATIDDVLLQTLTQSGALGLVSRRFRSRTDAVALDAVAAWRWQMVQSVVRGRLVARVVQALRSAGVDPVLLKGLAAERHYRGAGLRPLGDLDLLVAPGEFKHTVDVIRELGFRRFWSGHPGVAMLEGPDGVIDLQTGLWPLSDDEAARVTRSEDSFLVEGVPVRVPQRDLEVRILAVHAVKHSFLRPIWLCDVAAAIENTDGLAWSSVLAGPWRIQSWVAGAIGMAARLLNLSLPHDIRARCQNTASWVDPLMLRRWGNGKQPVIAEEEIFKTLHVHKSARDAIHGVVHGWPDPLHVVAHHGWPLHHTLARASVVLVACVRGSRMIRHFPDARE